MAVAISLVLIIALSFAVGAPEIALILVPMIGFGYYIERPPGRDFAEVG